jgi:hypothetical protein
MRQLIHAGNPWPEVYWKAEEDFSIENSAASADSVF